MLAIVIPYFKISFFEDTLQSLANQTNKRFKVYIGDDASPDNPVLLLKKFEGQFEFVYQRFESNLGGVSLVKQWERCMSLTNDEEWIVILGDDDVFDCNVVEEFYKQLINVQKANLNVIRFAVKKINALGQPISQIYQHPVHEKSVEFIFRRAHSSLSEYFFKRIELFKIGFKDLPMAWSSDRLAVLEVSNFDVVYTINEAVVSVRISDQSISGSRIYDSQKLKALFKYNYYLVDTYKAKFTMDLYENQKKRLNKCYLYSKKDVIRYFMINYVYLKKGDIRGVFDFHFEILGSLRMKLNEL